MVGQLPFLSDVMKVVFFPQVRDELPQLNVTPCFLTLRSIRTKIGFLVSLDHHPIWMNGNGLPEDFVKEFDEGETSYFKTGEMREMDMEFGDLDAKIKDKENLIIADLEDDILDCEAELREAFGAIADLDCILSFAEVAADLGYVRPTVVPATENRIDIQNGAHPLQDLLVENEFVRNDTAIDGTNRMNVVTGPNFSGKSCYARQVGILTYMAHVGSFLPCDAAVISVVDRILAQFSSVETCDVPQSSFQLDLTRIGRMVRSATPSSLLLIDEFGKGELRADAATAHLRAI